jgi:glycosyltransferase involved in cell wall biosynthesis
MTPRVTVLLAVHDGEPYVRQSVASVLSQTFADFELLVVDDASTDTTVATIEALGDERIRLLRNEHNLGQVPSLNRGLAEAGGEYVARLDHDDWCRPTRLERQVALLDAHPEVGLVGTWMEVVEEGGRRIAWLRETIEDFARFVYQTLIMRVYVSHPSAMYRREPVLALGGYDVSTGPSEDKDLWRRLALERWDARIVPEPLVVYRLHESQLSQTRAEYQATVDGVSQERFLRELAPDAPVHDLRLLLAADPRFWHAQLDDAELLRGLALLLAGARERLRLDEAETAKVERLVLGRLLEVARTNPWRRTARTLSTYALARLPQEERTRARAAAAIAYPLAPARAGVRRLGRTAANATDALPGLHALRRPAKRSRLVRFLYGKLVGGR